MQIIEWTLSIFAHTVYKASPIPLPPYCWNIINHLLQPNYSSFIKGFSLKGQLIKFYNKKILSSSMRIHIYEEIPRARLDFFPSLATKCPPPFHASYSLKKKK